MHEPSSKRQSIASVHDSRGQTKHAITGQRDRGSSLECLTTAKYVFGGDLIKLIDPLLLLEAGRHASRRSKGRIVSNVNGGRAMFFVISRYPTTAVLLRRLVTAEP
jgi:hypothetical protein